MTRHSRLHGYRVNQRLNLILLAHMKMLVDAFKASLVSVGPNFVIFSSISPECHIAGSRV